MNETTWTLKTSQSQERSYACFRPPFVDPGHPVDKYIYYNCTFTCCYEIDWKLCQSSP